jgi:very-short-patch-repair endonuclease
MPLPYNKKLTPRAIALRKDSTPQENKLWYRFLNKYPVRFKRQKPIDNFIADFYCDSAMLIVELDGSQHFTEDGRQYDETRSRILEHYGLQVLRFTNSDVDTNFDIVCEQIDETVKQRTGIS